MLEWDFQLTINLEELIARHGALHSVKTLTLHLLFKHKTYTLTETQEGLQKPSNSTGNHIVVFHLLLLA